MDYPKVHKLIVLKTFDNDVFISAEKAYDKLEIKIDRSEFDRLVRELKNKLLINEHGVNKGCYKVSTFGEYELKITQREAGRLDALPIKQPKIEEAIHATRRIMSGLWKYVSENPLISAIIAGVIIYLIIKYLLE